MSSAQLPLPLQQWIESSIGPGAKIRAIFPQGGATSSTLHRLEVEYASHTLHLVLRRFTNPDWLAEEPGVAAHEAAALQKVQSSGLPAPRLIAFDADGHQAGIPALLMTQVPGKVNLIPAHMDAWLRQQAEVLPQLHAVDPSDFPWKYAPYNALDGLIPPAWSRTPQRWEKAIEIVHTAPPPAPERFIHRDYHPVNVLWQGGRLSGIVDWPNACRGPAGIDLSWCRMNLALLYGPETADQFLAAFQALGVDASEYDPYWDLMVIIELLPGPPTVYPPWVEYGATGLTDRLMLERAEAYLASVLARLGV